MRSKTGIIVSKKMEKTLVVKVDDFKAHSKYKKQVRTSKRVYVDNPENAHEVGDKITVYETRPLSKLKRWTVVPPMNNDESVA
ncbi:30S ribosomal protein S17 [Candidatus Peregrinibacteria bacterium CG_4_9_14_0_2_um_filter_53_11]|nr:MAG: 30S ribosomal protein S17 [Candidatus Peregrinibacteria bacterium CG_4_9_14_0_2_um_filter_53_11]